MVDDMCKGTKADCDATSPYRTIAGNCNNPVHGKEFKGAMSTPFRRGQPAFLAFNLNFISFF